MPKTYNFNLSEAEEKQCLDVLYRKQEVKVMNPRKKYVCAVCKSVCDLFGLFFHMKEVHQGMLCQYCLKLFKRVSDLETHMKNAHGVRRMFFHSFREFSKYCGTDYSFACGNCSQILRYQDLDKHPCGGVRGSQPKRLFDCPYCDRNFSFQSQLEIHLCNGWCKGMNWLKNPSNEETVKLYKVLTGIDMVRDYENNRGRGLAKLAKKNAAQMASKELRFDLADKNLLNKLKLISKDQPGKTEQAMLEGLPSSGSIFCNAKTINNYVRKEIRESGYNFDLASKLRDVDLEIKADIEDLKITRAGTNFIIRDSLLEREFTQQQTKAKNAKSGKTQALAAAPVTRFKEEQQVTGISDQEWKPEDQELDTVTKSDAEMKPSPLVLKLPAVKAKKESKTQRRTRIANEIYWNMVKIKEAIDHFQVRNKYCNVNTYSSFINESSIYIASNVIPSLLKTFCHLKIFQC